MKSPIFHRFIKIGMYLVEMKTRVKTQWETSYKIVSFKSSTYTTFKTTIARSTKDSITNTGTYRKNACL